MPLLLSLLTLLLLGCTSAEQSGSTVPASSPSGAASPSSSGAGQPSTSPEASGSTVEPSEGGGPTAGARPTPSPTPERSFAASPIGQGEVVFGTLGFDAVEGGCGFLEMADGRRYEVIYPDGWRLDRTSGQLLGPDGQAIGAGAVVSVRGSVATDIASICQLGPIFVATEVLIAGG